MADRVQQRKIIDTCHCQLIQFLGTFAGNSTFLIIVRVVAGYDLLSPKVHIIDDSV